MTISIGLSGTFSSLVRNRCYEVFSTKDLATLDENSFLAKHHMLHSHRTGYRRGDKN